MTKNRLLLPHVLAPLAILAAVPLSPSPSPGQDAPRSAHVLEGFWSAGVSRSGNPSELHLRLTRKGDGPLTAFLSLPAIDVWDLPLGPVSMSGDTVRAAIFELHHDEADRALTGELPEALVPVHTIPVRFRPSAEPDRAPEPEPLPAAPDPVWIFEAGGPVWGGIEIDADGVYVGSEDGNVYALDAEAGTERWRYATEGPVRAAPLLHENALYVHSDDGYLHVLNPADGALIRRIRLGDPVFDRPAFGAQGYRYDSVASAPIPVPGAIVVGHGQDLVAVDPDSGGVRWRFTADDIITSTPAAGPDGVIFGSFDGKIRNVHTGSGALLWSHDTGAPVAASPALFGELVIVGSRSYEVLALRLAAGSPAWSFYDWFSWAESSPVVRDGVAYAGSSDSQKLRALDAATGSPIWEFDTGGSAWARPAVTGDAVFIGAVGVAGYVVEHRGGFLCVDRDTGAAIWRYDSPRPEGASLWGFGAAPAAGEGCVVAADLQGRVFRFPR